MRWLLFLVAVSASADCTSHLAYRTPDYIAKAVIDDGGLYLSLLLARDIERIDLATGDQTIVNMGPPLFTWDVQRGLLVTPATIGRPEQDVLQITIRDGSVYWLETDSVLRRMILGGGTAMTVAERVAQYRIFGDRVLFISEGKLFWKRFTDAEPTLVMTNVASIGSISSNAILVSTFSNMGLYQGRAQVLRVSWSGDVLETLYRISFTTYHNTFDFQMTEVDGIVYVARRQYGTSVWTTTLLAIQGGFAREIYSTTGDMWILDANEHGITFADWGLSTGFHDVVQLHCVSTPRARAVR